MVSPETKPIRLLIVDDHEIVRIGLRNMMTRGTGIEVVGEAGSTAAGVSEATRLNPDVVLLDVRLPDGSGFDACRKIQELPADIKVLILTSFADDDTVFEAISSGADGYLLKEINGDQLITAIRTVASGQSILDPMVTRRVLGRVKNGNITEQEERLAKLSAQERRVLALVAKGKTNKEIGLEMGLSDKTVKNYFSNVLDKLQLTRRSQAAAFFVEHSNRTGNKP